MNVSASLHGDQAPMAEFELAKTLPKYTLMHVTGYMKSVPPDFVNTTVTPNDAYGITSDNALILAYLFGE